MNYSNKLLDASMIAVLSSALKRLGTSVSVPGSVCSPCMSSEGKYAFTHLLSKYWIHLIHRVQASLILIRHATQSWFKCSNASFLANSVCTLLLSTEKTTTCVIQAISIMNILEPFVASSFKLLDFFDTSGDVSTVFFDAKAQWSHCTNDVSLLQLGRVGLNQPSSTGSTGHRHGLLKKIAWQVHPCFTMAFAVILNG